MIVVTGSTGLLGSHLLFKLSEKGLPIKALYRNEQKIDQVRKLFEFYDPNGCEERFERIEWLKCDILDIPALEDAIQPNDQVYHCAALVSFDKRHFKDLIRINRRGTENIVNVSLAKGVAKMCYVSSTAAIGADKDPIDEKCSWKNGPDVSGYSVSKYSAEKEVWRGIEEGLNAVIVNPCVIFGAGNWNDSSLAIYKTVQKGNKFYPPGANATVDARDVADIMVSLMESDINSERFLCVGSNQTFQTLITEIATQLGIEPPRKEAKKWLVNSVRIVSTFLLFLIGKRPLISKDTMHNLFATRRYSTSKIEQTLNFKFRDLKEQVSNSIAGRLD